jgi:hypothetical protein
MFRARRSEPRFDAAICSALLAPDVLHSASSTDFEYVSGGCWSETREAAAITPKDSFELGHSRPSCWSWHDCQCSGYVQEECTGATDVIGSAWNRNLESTCHICEYTSQSETRCMSSRHPCSQTWLGQASANVTSDIASANSCMGYPSLKYNRKHPEESSELGYNASRKVGPMRDIKTQNILNVMQTNGREERVYKSDMCSDTDPESHALLAESAVENISTDTISITASSAVLSPAMMPRVVRGGMITDKGSDCDSLGTDSAYSVEADEMIEIQPQNWKRSFRDAWHRARLIRVLRS